MEQAFELLAHPGMFRSQPRDAIATVNIPTCHEAIVAEPSARFKRGLGRDADSF
jgi:hypothetical protein